MSELDGTFFLAETVLIQSVEEALPSLGEGIILDEVEKADHGCSGLRGSAAPGKQERRQESRVGRVRPSNNLEHRSGDDITGSAIQRFGTETSTDVTLAALDATLR